MFNPLDQCFSLASRRMSRVISVMYDKALAETGLKTTQFSVLTAINHAQAHDAPLGTLAQALDMDQSSLTRALGAFVRDGLVDLSNSEDKRRKTARLTDKGAELLATATKAWAEAQAELHAILGPALFDDGKQTMNDVREKISKKHPERN